MLQRFYAGLRAYHPIVHSLIAGVFLIRLGSSMSLPFLAIYLDRQTDMSYGMIGMTVGAGALAGMVGGFVGGTLSDRIGRRRVMLWALYVWTLVFAGFAINHSPLVFVLLSALQGLCRSFYEPVSQALMGDVTPPDKRIRVFSMRYMAINVGVTIGPLVGVYFGIQGGAQPFLITAVVYLIYAVMLQVLLNRFGIRRIEGQKKEQVTFRGAWSVVSRDAAFRLFLLGSTLNAVGYAQMTTTLGQFLTLKFADGDELFAILMSVNAVVVVLMQMPLIRWAQKKTPLQSILTGVTLYALGDLGFAFSGTWAWFILSMFVFTLGEILVHTTSDVFIDRLAPEHLRGAYFGSKSLQNLGQFIGPALGGAILADYGGTAVYVVIAAVTMASGAFFWGGYREYVLRTRRTMAGQTAFSGRP